jgi:hypothetical protein
MDELLAQIRLTVSMAGIYDMIYRIELVFSLLILSYISHRWPSQ